MENADLFGSSTAPLTWHDFLERMRQPSAADFVKAIKSFIVSFSNNPPDPERDSAAVQEFLSNMEAAFRAHSLWAGCSEDELESAGEGLEKYVMTKLFSRVFASVPDDVKVDDQLYEKMALIQQFIRPENLDIQPTFQNETSWLLAQKELQKINMYKAPRDKLVCILNCCKVINNLLLNASIASNQNPPGADEFLPVLIFVTIKANPPQLHSNLLYIQRYRRQSRLVAETAYFFTNILSAESFISNIDANALSMDDAEFQNNMESARALLSGLSAESDDLSSQSYKNLISRAEPGETKKQVLNMNKHQNPTMQSQFSVGSSEAKLGNKDEASGKDQQTMYSVLSTSDLENIGASMLMMEDKVVRYKARLVAQGFSQRPGIDYEETYSPVMDAITFRFFISLVVTECLDMRLMDVVTAYLYGSLDADIYMKVPEGYTMPKAYSSKPRSVYSLKLQKSLYGLKQSGRMWYKRLSDYLLKEGYENDPICPCIFTKKSNSGFAIIAVYVDDLNLVGNPEELIKTAEYLKKEFEMKDHLGKTKFCLGLQIEHLPTGILVHQSTYTEKVLKQFYMGKAHPLSTPMVVRSLDVNKDPFRPQEEGEEILGPEVPYMSAIGALMYLANCTRPDIAFSVNLLSRYSSAPTQRHWKGIKHIFRYLRGTVDLGLFYSNGSKSQLIGYADAGYLSDPHKARSQTGYVFTCGDTAISWRSVKQTLTATSSNHSEIIAIHETSRECVGLRSMIQHIRGKCGLSSIKDNPTILHEDNAACITQIKTGYIKGDRTKHISPKFFYTHDLQKSGDIDVQQIRSSDNLADLFTKALPTATFKKLVNGIGMRRLKDISCKVEGE